MKIVKACGMALTVALGLIHQGAAAQEPPTKASVIMYHRFGEQDFPSTNVTMEQFNAHVTELKTGGYNVAPLPDIIAALKSGTALPPKTVGLSVDDAYESVYTKAWPILKEAGFPFTLFVATEAVDKRLGRYMSWDQVRDLQSQGVTIGSQTKTHPHMPRLSDAQVRAELEESNARFKIELGEVPDLIAYPYGEASLAVMNMSEEMGFVAGFGQHSGAIGNTSPMYYLPRFAMNEAFGSLERFKLAANVVPIGAADITPVDPVIGAKNPPAIGFTVTWPTKNLDRLNCFASHSKNLEITRLGNRLEIRTPDVMPQGRTRLNCTMPAGNGTWHWFGRQFYVPN